MTTAGEAIEVDVVVIGAGPVGENVADRAIKGGLEVAVVEAERAGGECSYWACMPSKALLTPLDLRAAAGRMDGVRQAVSGPVDVAAVLARRDSFASHWDDTAQADWLSGAGATLVRGRGRLAGERAVEVVHDDGMTSALNARRAVVVATGSTPTLPPIVGIDSVPVWTNREGTGASEVPASLVVLGGGAVGCELATAWRRLGSRVTLVQHSERLLPALEPEAGERVAAALRGDDVDVRLGTSITSVAPEDGGVRATLDDGGTVGAEKLLVAAGRRPGTQRLGLGSVGLSDGQTLTVDDTTAVAGVAGSWLYAVGDCTDRAKLTHMGKYQARVCADVLVARFEGEEVDAQRYDHLHTTAEHTAVTQVVFTDPQVAAVGLTEEQARAAGGPVETVSFDPGSTAGGALRADGYSGVAKLVVDPRRRVVLGATFVGQGVDELLHAATIAVVGEVPLDRLWHAVPAFPTINEVWLRLLETYGL